MTILLRSFAKGNKVPVGRKCLSQTTQTASHMAVLQSILDRIILQSTVVQLYYRVHPINHMATVQSVANHMAVLQSILDHIIFQSTVLQSPPNQSHVYSIARSRSQGCVIQCARCSHWNFSMMDISSQHLYMVFHTFSGGQFFFTSYFL